MSELFSDIERRKRQLILELEQKREEFDRLSAARDLTFILFLGSGTVLLVVLAWWVARW